MDHKLDVFISYAHIDNQPLLANTQGWVTVFHEALAQLLSRYKGGVAQIWRDPKLAGNALLWKEIEDRIGDAAALVTVLTPRYVKSPSCAEEIEGFCRTAERSGGLVVQNAARVFKVIKTPVDSERSLPPIVGELLGYEFFRLDADKTPQEFDPLLGESAREEFLRKVNKVAWDIKRLLDSLQQAQAAQAAQAPDAAAPAAMPAAMPAADTRPVVYLAECSRDGRTARENVEAELRRLGYTVLPDRQLPTDEADYVTAVDAMLGRCGFSIHLVGSGYGLVPEGIGQKSVVELQNECAAGHFGAGGIRRVIWIAGATPAEDTRQQGFVERLHHSAEAQAGADLMTGDLETLKTALRAHLKRLERPAAAPPSAAAGPRKVFVVCDARDRIGLVPLIKALRERGLAVSLPLFSGDAGQVREAFAEQAAGCDVALLYYGAGDEAWKYHQTNELRKARGARPDAAALVEATWVAAPASDDKTLLTMLGEPHVIDASAGVSDAALAALLRLLAGTGAGAGAAT